MCMLSASLLVDAHAFLYLNGAMSPQCCNILTCYCYTELCNTCVRSVSIDQEKEVAMSTQSQNVSKIARPMQLSRDHETRSRSVSQEYNMDPTAGGLRRHPQVPQFQPNPRSSEPFQHTASSSLHHGKGHLPNTLPGMVLPTISPRRSTSSDCPPYKAGYKVALEHLHELMRRGHVPEDNWKQSGKPDLEGKDEDSTNYFTPATENMGCASVGLPSPCVPSIDNPFLTPPELPLFAGVHNRVDVPMRASSSIPNFTSSPPASRSLCFSENRDASRRTMQRRADTKYAEHKKQNSREKFKIQTDAAGNIIANKLRVTSAVNSLMERYVDVVQIHYDDDNERFKLIEDAVRDVFEFEPPLKENWFPIYMRKKLEKNRSEFRKHWEDKGERHPKCTPEKACGSGSVVEQSCRSQQVHEDITDEYREGRQMSRTELEGNLESAEGIASDRGRIRGLQ